ncbi:hypothetical protein VB620_15295 [Nodularia harveyana UHCC-0300]|uniref:Uncharacterized protein n=1 Tax=Nodularia harveyana UHCC-0300 TaxID=2974287 RepID=A0ABU5UH90_9CYAN|nr:hypothetical protein [Nodularia harveyana]MEA5582703.1 hypothetical protein [Nodularia harveyana UHCC-0300]
MLVAIPSLTAISENARRCTNSTSRSTTSVHRSPNKSRAQLIGQFERGVSLPVVMDELHGGK